MPKKNRERTGKRREVGTKQGAPHPDEPARRPTRKYDTRVWVEAVCRLCGAKTSTRFVPRNPKAVLCEDCFEKEFGRPPPGSPEPTRSKLYRATCSECGGECEVPWKPDRDRPAVCWYCRNEVERPEKKRLSHTSGGKVRLIRKKRPKKP